MNDSAQVFKKLTSYCRLPFTRQLAECAYIFLRDLPVFPNFHQRLMTEYAKYLFFWVRLFKTNNVVSTCLVKISNANI